MLGSPLHSSFVSFDLFLIHELINVNHQPTLKRPDRIIGGSSASVDSCMSLKQICKTVSGKHHASDEVKVYARMKRPTECSLDLGSEVFFNLGTLPGIPITSATPFSPPPSKAEVAFVSSFQANRT